MSQKKIIFTGGGTGGHVIPNIAIIKALEIPSDSILYIGSKKSIEESLIKKEGIRFAPIFSGKLRRYFSLQNFIDPLKVLIGFLQSLCIIYRFKPQLVFSKGGFVSLPVVYASWILKIPIIIHESDLSPGLTTKLTASLANKILLTFKESLKFFKDPSKVVICGSPVRESLLNGSRQRGLQFCGLSGKLPILLVMGGSTGSAFLNTFIGDNLDSLLKNFEIIQITGARKSNPQLENISGYKQFEYVGSEIGDIFAAADLILSRAGANTLYEILRLKKPALLIPLPRGASRGDQLENAAIFEQAGISLVIREESANIENVSQALEKLLAESAHFVDKMSRYEQLDGLKEIKEIIKAFLL
ncbi:MAG TPA: undecaprenyldiphospho-muramoylpentapeptide beta-N-acetylglucosaminyltransferase [Oligoflexia bacterium]|nr:undecaprenyldiphospho-muramoylpentapeptide beta-N-acetylglucosaminyltransferase [Oligoflexia bacterium]HMP27163.1 undecaprenyldiphospho-muramoylpentapeptide beta-N-acetylglucosaminyltransferase [Oligoflexia bacterium]